MHCKTVLHIIPERIMILISNFVQSLSTTKYFIWYQNFHASCSQPFCDLIGFCQLFLLISNRRQTWIISRHSFERKNIYDFFFLPFFSMKDCYEIIKNTFCAKYRLSKFQKVCCSTRSTSQPNVRKCWSLVVVVMSALLQRCQKKQLYTLKVKVIVIHLYNLNP